MAFLGDFNAGATIDTSFCTVQATGAPTTLSGSPVVKVFQGNNTTANSFSTTQTANGTSPISPAGTSTLLYSNALAQGLALPSVSADCRARAGTLTVSGTLGGAVSQQRDVNG